MNQQNLAPDKQLVFDALSEKYVVCEKDASSKASSFGLFGRLFAQKSQQQPPPPDRPPRPDPPPPPPVTNPAANLSGEIYNDLDTLLLAYRDLQEYADVDKELFSNFENQTLILRTTMGNIYRALSSNALPPLNKNRLKLEENLCANYNKVANFAGDVSDKVVDLLGLVNISSIDRQLWIINATLISQERKLTKLYNNCRIRNN